MESITLRVTIPVILNSIPLECQHCLLYSFIIKGNFEKPILATSPLHQLKYIFPFSNAVDGIVYVSVVIQERLRSKYRYICSNQSYTLGS